MNAVTPYTEYGYSRLRNARSAEYDAFSRVTRMLRQADSDGRGAFAIEAIHKNNELWTTLATDLSQPGNGLPDQLKAGLLSLAIFSLRHGRGILGKGGSVQILIDINMSMMKGLRHGGDQ